MVRDFRGDGQSFREEILAGLDRPRKEIACKHLYDDRGAELFDRICELDEYYLTRTELEIMRSHGSEMAEWIGARSLLVEYGSGSGVKTQILLEHLEEPVGYVPIDICRENLTRSVEALSERHPQLEIMPVCADYTSDYEVPEPRTSADRRVVYFPGSTIGNFPAAEAQAFLKDVTQLCGEGGGLLIGVDLIKDPLVLERAYDDDAGVTAQFILNVLSRINRELDADFDLDRFVYRAEYNKDEARVEMGAVSLEDQLVHVAGEKISVREGECIQIEHSHKYSLESFRLIAAPAGLAVQQVWTDPDELFSVQYLTAA